MKKEIDNDILYIAVTFDIDNDEISYGYSSPILKRVHLSWEGVGKGIPIITDQLRSYVDNFGNEMIFTWFVRVDNQLQEIYNDEGYLLKTYKKLWKTLINAGDEIGWHIHLYRYKDKKWLPETRDDICVKQLLEGYKTIIKHGYSITSSRIGGCYHTNETMKTLDELRIRIDSTALPNRKRKDKELIFDWLNTPYYPYHPSVLDYRIPNKESLSILEAPMSTVKIKLPYDEQPVDRYFNLSFYNSLMRDSIRYNIRNRNIIITITHPYEIISETYSKKLKKSHPLISFDIKEVKKNINTIISECKKIGRSFQFIKISDICDIYNNY